MVLKGKLIVKWTLISTFTHARCHIHTLAALIIIALLKQLFYSNKYGVCFQTWDISPKQLHRQFAFCYVV